MRSLTGGLLMSMLECPSLRSLQFSLYMELIYISIALYFCMSIIYISIFLSHLCVRDRKRLKLCQTRSPTETCQNLNDKHICLKSGRCRFMSIINYRICLLLWASCLAQYLTEVLWPRDLGQVLFERNVMTLN